MHKQVALSGVAMLGLLSSALVHADVQPGFYLGASVGTATLEADDLDFDANDTAFKVFAGYAFNRYFAVEGAYINAGEPDERVDLGIGGPFSLTAEPTGFNFSAVATLPLGEAFSLFGKVGMAFYDIDVTARSGAQSISVDDSEEDLSWGVGAALQVTRAFSLRAEYEAVNVDDGDFNIVSVGAVYKF